MSRAPYKYLDYYKYEDQDLFFGREEEVTRLVGEIMTSRLMVLFSPSGSGKTSLINAGVRPELERNGYRTVYVRLDKEPVEAVIDAAIEQLKLSHRERTDELLPFLERAFDLAPGGTGAPAVQPEPWVIFIDQFEEFFITYRRDPEVRRSFIRQLAQVNYDMRLPIFFVLSLREDYYVELHEFREEIPSIFQNNANVRLRPFTDDQALRAISLPAKAVGLTYETGLEARIVADLKALEGSNGGVQPIALQMVCHSLWRESDGRQIASRQYDHQGGAQRIIGNALKDALAEIPAWDQRLAIDLFEALKFPDGTKRFQNLEDLELRVKIRGGRDVAPILGRLVRLDILRHEKRKGQDWYEFKHDYLVPGITQWIEQSRERIARRRLLFLTISPFVLALVGTMAYGLGRFFQFKADFHRNYDGQKWEVVVRRAFNPFGFEVGTGILRGSNQSDLPFEVGNQIEKGLILPGLDMQTWLPLWEKLKDPAKRGEWLYKSGHRQEGVSVLIEAARDEAFSEEAFQALVKLGKSDGYVVDALVEVLARDSGSARPVAMLVLGEIDRDEPKVIRAVTDVFKTGDGEARMEAAITLSRLGIADSNVLAALAGGLRDTDAEVVKQAAIALGALGVEDASVIQALVKTLSDSAAAFEVAEALVQLGTQSPVVIDALLNLFKTGNLPGKIAAVTALGELGETEPKVTKALEEALADADIVLRSAAISAIGDLGIDEPAILRTLVSALSDKDARKHAASALGKIGRTDPWIIESLIAALRKTKNTWEYDDIESPILDLGTVDPKVSRILSSEIKKDIPEGRLQLISLLGTLEMSDPDAYKALLAAFKDTVQDISEMAANTLAKMVPVRTQVVEALDSALQKGDLVAGEALARIGISHPSAIVAPLIAAFKTLEGRTKARLIEILYENGISDPQIHLLLSGSLADPDHTVRIASAKALLSQKQLLPTEFETLFPSFKIDDPEDAEMVSLFAQMGKSEPRVIEYLRRLLKVKNEAVKGNAAISLARLGYFEAEVKNGLLSSLRIPDWRWSGESQVDSLLLHWANTDSTGLQKLLGAMCAGDSATRVRAAGIVGSLKKRDLAFDALVEAQRDESNKVRGTAETSLGQMLKHASAEAILDMLQDKRSGYRQAAALAFTAGSLTPTARLEDRIRELRSDSRPWVRIAAWDALDAIRRHEERQSRIRRSDGKFRALIAAGDSAMERGDVRAATQKYLAAERAGSRGGTGSYRNDRHRAYAAFRLARAKALLNRKTLAIGYLEEAVELDADLKDTLRAELARPGSGWEAVRDNWYLNRVLLQGKGPLPSSLPPSWSGNLDKLR